MTPPDFRVSVVITSYNQKDYLIEALESVIHQTVRPHEIIVADDCSTDGSVSTIHDYMKQYPGWVKGVFQHRNSGIPVNRNAGLRHVTGTYVSILDGDDLFVSNKVEQEITALRQHPKAQCIYSNVQFINSIGQPMGLRDQEDQPSGDIFSYVAPGRFGLPRSMVINHQLFKSIGFFDERFPKYDGFDLTLQLAARCQFIYLSEPLVDYRVHSTSDSTQLKAEAHLHDLEGIYQKLTPLLNRFSSDEQKSIHHAWAKRLFRWRIFDAIQQGHIIHAVALIWNAFFKESIQIKDLARMVKAAFKGETYRNTLLRKV